VLKRIAIRFATALLAALSQLDLRFWLLRRRSAFQAPGFFRLKVGDLEVTTLYDASVSSSWTG